MRRREFIAGLGSAAAWPLVAWAQQGDRMRRIGVLMLVAENDPGSQAQRAALQETLAGLGWIEGHNLEIALRITMGDLNAIRALAAELVGLQPDVIITSGSATTRAVAQQTSTIPIVFAAGPDPASQEFAQNIVRPEGNITGFSNSESAIAGKWLQLLKEAAPRTTKVAVIFNRERSLGTNYLPSIDATARTLEVQTVTTAVHDAIGIVRSLDALAGIPNTGLLVLPPSPGTLREMIVPLAIQHRLPAIYPSREDAIAGGLLAYAPDQVDQYRRAASYVDRLLRGATVRELPVQFPAKYELVVNLKTARATGLIIPESLVLRANEIIV